MKLSFPTSKQIRFDYYPEKVDDPTIMEVTIDASLGFAEAEQGVGIICVWRVNSLNYENDEVIGYLGEVESTIVEFGSKQDDLIILTQFISNSFISVELAFQNKAITKYNIFGHTRPQFESLAQSFLTHLMNGGYYQ